MVYTALKLRLFGHCVGTLHDASMSTIHIMLSAHIKNTDVPLCYRSVNVHQQRYTLLIILLLTYLTDWTEFSPKKLGLNPNTNLHHMCPWDVSGVSTLILQVSKYAKFSWHLNEKLLPQLAMAHDLNTKQTRRGREGLGSVATAFPRLTPTRLHPGLHYG